MMGRQVSDQKPLFHAFGVRSGRGLCEAVRLNLAYRWFYRLPHSECQRLVSLYGV